MSVSAEKRIPSEFAFCGHRLHQRQFLTQLPLSSVICSSLSKAERSKKGFNKSLHSDVWFDLFGNKQLSRQGTSKLARQIQIYLFPHFLRIFLNEKKFWLCPKKREVGLLTRDERKKNQKSLHQTFSPLWAGVNFFLEIITNCAFQFCHKLQKYSLLRFLVAHHLLKDFPQKWKKWLSPLQSHFQLKWLQKLRDRHNGKYF